MDEARWLASTDVNAMLCWLRLYLPRNIPDVDYAAFYSRYLSDRKSRLFTVACCRRIWDTITNEKARTAVSLAERHADGKIGAYQRQCVWGATHKICQGKEHNRQNILAVRTVADNPIRDVPPLYVEEDAPVLREIVGNPFKLYTREAVAQLRNRRDWLRWNNGCIFPMAQDIYLERKFEELPILADALDEAGCVYQPLLQHLRSDDTHYRGCWALDIVLGNR